jgi:hypothetical protein
VREQVPLWFGLIGPSGSGKTYSALRLATGIQSVTGGELYVIDTESRRSLHYADKFRFRHVEFAAPFGPLDYLAAIEHCVAHGASVIVIDSISHEHEGPGGVLESHDRIQDELAEKWHTSREKTNMSAWAQPKAERRRLINTMLQLPCSFVLCFRAKEKIKIARGDEKNGGKTVARGTPLEIGWQAIGADEYVYELLARALLPPGCSGVPQWLAAVPGEALTIKLPEQFRGVLDTGEQLNETMGLAMAEWARGAAVAEHPLIISAREAALLEAWIVEHRAELNAAPADVKKIIKRMRAGAET